MIRISLFTKLGGVALSLLTVSMAASCDNAADAQRKVVTAQTQASDKIANATKEVSEKIDNAQQEAQKKIINAQTEAEKKIADAEGAFSKMRDDYRTQISITESTSSRSTFRRSASGGPIF